MAYFRCTTGGSGKGNTLVVTCADELAGATITCTNGTKTYNKTCPSTSPYEVTFYGLEAGTWTVSATVSGNTYTATVVITDYEAELGGFSWRRWVDTASQLDSTDYASLSEVLADEEAVRELCLEHACVDYLASIATTSEDVETIIENDLFAKWVNNSDYALDFLYANAVIADLMDEADKYFYGEWVITDNTTTPPTWGAKGNVPVMTSDSAPYGTAFGSRYGNNANYYMVFDGNDATQWSAGANYTTNQYVGYKFVNPVRVTRVSIMPSNDSATAYNRVKNFKVQGSNTGDTNDWHDIYTGICQSTSSATPQVFTFDNDDYYLQYRVYVVDSYSSVTIAVLSLQFYGRELSVSVPKMATNTTPYGEASADYIGGSHYPWHAFDNDDSTYWGAYPQTDNDLFYEAVSPYVPKMISFITESTSMQIFGSKDGNSYVPLTDIIQRVGSTRNYCVSVNDDNEEYKYFKANAKASNTPSFYSLQIYGLDYSEKEFEEGTTKKWLYDHGVELVDIYTAKTGSAVVTKEENAIYIKTVNGQMAAFSNNEAIDLTSYNLVRAKNEPMVTTYATPVYAQIFIHPNKATSTSDYSSNYVAVGNFTNEIINTFGLDISAINTAEYIQYGFYGGNSYTENRFKELWLE